MVDILISGGPVMIPLGALSLVALAIIIERLWVLRRSNFLENATVQTLSGLLASDKFQSTIDFCRRHPGPFTDLVTALVENRPGVLSRVANLFRRRSFNIDSLTVGRTHQDDRAKERRG